jgi:hypothetical protein
MKHLFAALTALALTAACSNAAETPEAATAIVAANEPAAAPVAAPEGESRPTEYALTGQKLPSFTAPMAGGGTFDSAALNQWTVIAVWGAWCGDSRTDGPYTAALNRAVEQDPDLDFISIHVPAAPGSEYRDKPFGNFGSLEAYFESAGYTLPVVLDTEGSVRETLKINWTPSYLLVSPDGIVRSFQTDLSVDKDQPVKTYIKNVAETRKAVRDLLASEPSGAE